MSTSDGERRLIVLGGAAAGGNPGQGCSGYLVESGDTAVVLDLGAGTLPVLRQHCDPRALDGIVISHLHLDHVLDLLALRYYLAYAPGVTATRIPLWLPPGGLAFMGRLAVALEDDGESDDYFGDVFIMDEYDPHKSLGIGDLSIAFAPTVHYAPCWAMRITSSSSGQSIGYSADTGPSAQLQSLTEGCSVVIAEASVTVEGTESWAQRGHLTPEEAGEIAAQAKASTLVLTHLWSAFDPEMFVRRAQSRTTATVVQARPGLTIPW